MKILMVTPYPPSRDGIGAYAVQSVRRLRGEGHDVTVLSPGPSAAHQHLDLVGPRGALALARRVRAYDKVIIQFHPNVFYPLPPTQSAWATESLALLLVMRFAREVEVVVHEIDVAAARRPGPYGPAARLLWSAVPAVVVHTEQERAQFAAVFGVRPARIKVMEHGRDFVRHTSADRSSARASLGIAPDIRLALAIGFLGRHKGFDRAVRAFRGMDPDRSRLDVVGEARVDEPAARVYVEELAALCRATPGATLHQGYVGDESFDRWLVAADVVVLPYRHIWTSGVLERAALYDRPVIAMRVGALAAQIGDRQGLTLVADDAEFTRALQLALDPDGNLGATGPVAEPWPDLHGTGDLRAGLQQQVRSRAAGQRTTEPVGSGAGAGGDESADERALESSVPLRRLHPLMLPPASAGRVGSRLARRLVRRLTAWQVDPLVHQVNSLQNAATQAVEQQARDQQPPGQQVPRSSVAAAASTSSTERR